MCIGGKRAPTTHEPTMTTAAISCKLSQYEREMLSAMYATLDYLKCNDLPGQKEVNDAICAIEAKA